MRTTRLLVRSCLAAFVSLGAAFAADAPEPPPLPSDLEERVDVRLVQVTILAIDENGRPVPDMRAEELIVEDEGRRMEVAFLEPLDKPRVSPTHARLFVLAPGGPNRPVSALGREPTTYLLLADATRVPRPERARIVESVVRFLSESLGPADQLAVLSTNDEIRVEAPLSFDREAVVEGVREAFAEAVNPRLDRELRLQALVRKFRSCGADASCRQFAVDGYENEVRSEGASWVRSIEGAIRYAGGLGGRKVILAVGPGAAVDVDREIRAAAAAASEMAPGVGPVSDAAGDRWFRSLRELADLAHARGVTVHFVAPPARGWFREISRGGEPGGFLVQPFEESREEAAREMREIATETGGTLTVSADVSDGLARTLDLERSAHVLGYYLPASARVRKFRDVRVHSTRDGVEVLATRAYREREPVTEGVSGEVVLGRSIAVPTDSGVARRVSFRVRVDPRELGYRVKGKEASVDFGFEVSLQRTSGETLVRSYHFIRHAYDKKDWKSGEVEPLEIDGWVEVVPGTYELRAAIHNARAGREGRWSKRLEVRESDPDASP